MPASLANRESFISSPLRGEEKEKDTPVGGRAPPVSETDRGLYIHYPYCEKKCPYCDFNVHAVPHDDRAYADAVIRELRARASAYAPPFSTLYFGGGTPSEWDPDALASVLSVVKGEIGLKDSAEITLESNPGTIGEARLEAFRALGVTRFSLGVQSFDDRELLALGRTHTGDEAAQIVRLAKATGARVSIDLIYGLPDQTEEAALCSVDQALALAPDHVSAYTLTIEPDTALGRRTRLGLYRPMDDDQQASMIEAVTDRLERAGFPRYEVSSYAPFGQEARHNSIYWTGGPYLGIGAGAHSYLPAPDLSSAIRRENVRGPEAYIASARADAFAATFEEKLDRTQVIGDRLLTGMRAAWGLDLAGLADLANLTDLAPALTRLAGEALIERAGSRIRPSPRGFLFADHIARTLLEALHSLDRPADPSRQ